MDTAEIRNLAIESSTRYYEYLEQNEKGRLEVTVNEMTPLPDKPNVYKLRLSAKLFDMDAVLFRLLTNKKLYTTGEVRILEYDSDKNILLVKPEDELVETFKKLSNRDIQIISDVKFLVERIRKWFELNGASVSLPKRPSMLRDSLSQLRYLPGLTPSAEQKSALEAIFHQPFVYIWGAPGTGKTQFVLSYSILHYLSHNKKVAIFAPTNNAIEQVLRGIIKMTDLAGIPRNLLIRLGAPSRKFAEEFPEVCEERGILQKMEELDKQIAKYNRLVSHFQEKRQWENAIENLVLFKNWDPLYYKILDQMPRMEQAREDYLKAKGQLDTIIDKISESQVEAEELEQKVRSLGNKLKKWLSKGSTASEIRLNEIRIELIELQSRAAHWREEVGEKQAHFKSQQGALSVAEEELQDLIAKIKQLYGPFEALKGLVAPLSQRNKKTIEAALDDMIRRQLDRWLDDDGIIGEYANHSLGELEQQLAKLMAIRAKYATASTEERLKGVNVIACTLDGFVGRFTEDKLIVDHVFLDEAGYANIVKTLTIFGMNTPVTFLGDHLQLPPVCEIKDPEIKRNPEYRDVILWAQSAIYLGDLFTQEKDLLFSRYLQRETQLPGNMSRRDLTQTFRFDKKLAEILNRHVYKNGFTSSLDKAQTEIYFIHAEKRDPPKSRVSGQEVKAIQTLLQQFDEQEEFIILTPYRNQVVELGKEMPRERNDLKILTVHKSQGQEWHTVILSVVDTGDKWFVDSTSKESNGLNLLNTAVSRAKNRLFIVCDMRFWKHQPEQLVTDLLKDALEFKLSRYA